MTPKYSQQQNSTNNNPKIGKTIINDFKRGDLKKSLFREIKDLYNFYLDDKERAKLKQMGKVRRWSSMVIWVLKSMFFKLTPFRRLLFVLALIALNFHLGIGIIQADGLSISFFIVLLILFLELKDKLLAQNELAVGRAVQNALMPEQTPKVTGWDIWLFTQPANEVGGDLVDFIKIDNNRIGLALGDVAGKGLGAALFMSKLQATLRAIVPNFTSFADLGAQMNNIFYRDGIPNRFSSLIYFEIEPDSGLVRILNAGHMPPITIQKSKIEEMPKGSTALGIQANSSYTEQQIELKKGEYLLIYSDGLTESRNEQGDFLGEQRLFQLLPKLQHLSAEQFGKKLLEYIEQFIGNASQNDDLSIILLKRTVS